jgi:hypothetical protein
VEQELIRRHYCRCSNNPGNATMYPFNTIPRPVLAYNEHDPRHTASHFGPFPRDIAQNILHALPLHDAASFRNASMINLYSYFECGEARTEHGARLATERMGATSSKHQIHFNLYSVLDIVRDNSRDATPASKARILARLIDEILRCRLSPLNDAYLSGFVASSVIAATAELPVAARAGMRWRLVNPLSGDVAFGYKHQLYNFIDAAIRSSGDLPVEDRELFQLVQKVYLFWLSYEGDESNMTPNEITDLISCIASLPHDPQVALLTRLADKIDNQRNRGPSCEAGRVALLSACKDWPLCERLGILTKVSPQLNYPDADFPWSEQQRADVREKEALLDECLLLPAGQRPAALAQLIRLFRKSLGPSYFRLLPTALPWTLASTLLAEAAKMKSVQSSAVVMAELHHVVPYFNLGRCKKTAAIFRQAFYAANENEARTRSRQLLCLDPGSPLIDLLCAEGSTIHPKTKLASSLLLRIEHLNRQERQIPKIRRHAKCAQDAIAIWKEASALGSRRCSDIRFKLLERLSKLPPEAMLPVFETILRDGHKLSTAMKVKLCIMFADIPSDWYGTTGPARPVIDAVIDLALSLPCREMHSTLWKVSNARCIMAISGAARMDLLDSVFDKCMAMPTAVMAPALIELAHSLWFGWQEDKDSTISLFYKILEKSAGFDAEYKGPLLAALARWFDFTASTALENACNALMSAVDTLPEASRAAWRLYLRIATRDRQPADQDSKVIGLIATALREECNALGGPQGELLSVMVRDTFYPGHGRLSFNG